MTADWKVPDATGLQAVISSLVTTASDVKLGDSEVMRSTKCLELVVQRIRGAVNSEGRCPLSVTVGSVPPEAEQHALVLAVQLMASTSAQLAKFAISEPGGGKTPFMQLVEAAEAWLKAVSTSERPGISVTAPTDPDPDFVSPIFWGDYQGSATDYADGTVTNQDMTTH